MRQVKLKIFHFIASWYNLHRKHSSIVCLSPINYKHKYSNQHITPNTILIIKNLITPNEEYPTVFTHTDLYHP